MQCSRAGWAGEAGLLQMPLCIVLHRNPSWQDVRGQRGTPPTYTGNCTSLRFSTYPELNEFRPCMWTIPFPLTDPQDGVSVAREMHPFTTESYSKKALAWQVLRKTAEIWQLWSLVDQTLYADDAHSPRAHLCVPRNNPNPHTHWKELLREGDHQQDVSAGETCAPLREWLVEVWAVEQVLFPNVLQLH